MDLHYETFMNHWYDAPVSILRRRMRIAVLLPLIAVLSLSPYAAGQDATAKSASASELSTGDKDETSTAKESSSQEETHQAKAAPTLAIVGATIVTLGPKGDIADGVILITGDTISAVGNRKLKIPGGTTTIDASGLTLTPGLVDAGSSLWLTSSAATSSASDASLNVLDGVDRYDDQWHEVARQGVTAVYVQPARGGTLGGYGAVLSVVPAEYGPVVHREFAAVQASLGIGASNNQARVQQLDRTKKALKAAADYQAKWDKYNEYMKKKQAAQKKATDKKASDPKSKSEKPSGDSNGVKSADVSKADAAKRAAVVKKPSEAKPASKATDAKKEAASKGKPAEKPPEKPEQDDAKERLAKVAKGEIPMRLEIHNADDAHYAHELLNAFPDMQVVFTGLTDLRSATESVRKLNAPVVVGPWLNAESNYRSDPPSVEVWADAFADYAGALVISSSGSSRRSSRLLRAHAGRAIAAGIDTGSALEAVTINAARSLGVDDKIGSIAVGKRADLAGFRGEPLDGSAPVALVVSGGTVVRQTAVSETVEETVAGEAELSRLASLLSVDSTRLAIKTKNFLTADGTTAEQTVVIDHDRGSVVSVSVGSSDVGASPTVQVVDLENAWVTPGLFSAHATLGLSGLVDPRLSDATYVVAADAVSVGFEGQEQLVQDGLLRAMLSPGGRNTISGCTSIIRLGAQDQVLSRVAAVKFSLSSTARSFERFPSSLAGQSQLIKQSLHGQLLDTRLFVPGAVQDRMSKERADKLSAIAEGEMLAVLSVSSDADIRAALDLVESQKLKAALLGAEQLAPFIDRIKALDVIVIARPVSVADYDWYCQDIAVAAKAGVSVCFAGENAEQLRLTAAMVAESGMSRSAVLSSLCFGPEQLRASDTSAADFVIWSQSPLNPAAKPLCVIVDGEVVSMNMDQRGTDEN